MYYATFTIHSNSSNVTKFGSKKMQLFKCNLSQCGEMCVTKHRLKLSD